MYFARICTRSLVILLVLLQQGTVAFGEERFGNLCLRDGTDWNESLKVSVVDKKRLGKLQQSFNQIFANVQTLFALNSDVKSKSHKEKVSTRKNLDSEIDEAFSLMNKLSHLDLGVKKNRNVIALSDIRSELLKVRGEYFDKDGNLWAKLSSRQQLDLFRKGQRDRLQGIDIKPEAVFPRDGKRAE